MPFIQLKNLVKIYDKQTDKAVNQLNLQIDQGDFVVLVRPSGCGKSTTLRMLAGLEEITAGEFDFQDQLYNHLSPQQRGFAMVFQNYALYPHLTVFDNMAFSLKMRRVKKDIIKDKVEEAAEILGLTDYLQRKPGELSGGQRQRVAMGRAIVRQPKAFLMDEPLSNLDAKLRVEMREEISRLYQKLKTTFIYVTHDQIEAMTLGTRVVVMDQGAIRQSGPPQELYEKPANLFVAAFIGNHEMNFIPEESSEANAVNAANSADQATDSRVLGVRPENIHLEKIAESEDQSDISTVGAVPLMDGNIQFQEMLGDDDLIFVENGPQRLSVLSPHRTDLNPGDPVRLSTSPAHIHYFDADTGEAKY